MSIARKTWSIFSFSDLDSSYDAMKAYVACFNFDYALKFFKFYNATLAIFLSKLFLEF